MRKPTDFIQYMRSGRAMRRGMGESRPCQASLTRNLWRPLIAIWRHWTARKMKNCAA